MSLVRSLLAKFKNILSNCFQKICLILIKVFQNVSG